MFLKSFLKIWLSCRVLGVLGLEWHGSGMGSGVARLKNTRPFSQKLGVATTLAQCPKPTFPLAFTSHPPEVNP